MSNIAFACAPENLNLFISFSFASSGLFDFLIKEIISSIDSRAFVRPSKMCARASASFKSNSVLLIIISLLKDKNSPRTSFSSITFGTPPTIASIIIPKVSCSCVYL